MRIGSRAWWDIWQLIEVDVTTWLMRCGSMAMPDAKQTAVRAGVQSWVHRVFRVSRATSLELAFPLPDSTERSRLCNPFEGCFPVIHSTPAQQYIAV